MFLSLCPVFFQVKDRTVIKTNDNETRVTEPVDLQNKIDELVKNWTNARSFVRWAWYSNSLCMQCHRETIWNFPISQKLYNFQFISLKHDYLSLKENRWTFINTIFSKCVWYFPDHRARRTLSEYTLKARQR